MLARVCRGRGGMAALTEGMVRVVVSEEIHATRFESFARAVVGQIEGGVQVMGTSPSWDMGRDGRGYAGANAVYVCCTLIDNVDSKAASDIKRAGKKTRKGDRLYFCTTSALSEHKVQEIERSLGKLVPKEVTTRVLGLYQLVPLGVQWPDLVEQFYKGELEAIRRALADTAGDDSVTGLQLALLAIGQDSSAAIRESVYRNVLLTALEHGNPVPLGSIAVSASNALKLSTRLPHDVVDFHLQRLVAEGIVRKVDGAFQLAKDPAQLKAESTSLAARRLLEGRNAIRITIEKALGQQIADEHFTRMWERIQEIVATEFYHRGQALVEEISSLMSSKVGAEGATVVDTGSLVNTLAEEVAATAANQDLKEELRTAVRGLFADQTSIAFDWLLQLCTSYLAICSLGLEATSGKEIERLLQRITLVFDTDIILSLLSEGEPAHESVKALVSRWKALHGRMLVGIPVLKEAAYHASIADADYKDVERWLPGTEQERIEIIENAFVRGFAQLLHDRKVTKTQWGRYISQFAGDTRTDHAKISAVLVQDYNISVMAGPELEDKALEAKVAKHLIGEIHETHAVARHRREDKARRDAELFASLARERRAVRRADPSAICLLVSSARRLAEVEAKFGERGQPHSVVTLSSVLYLLTLVPNVSIGLGALKGLLFDQRITGFPTELERLVVRLVKNSRELLLPSAKRASLVREVRTRLLDDAEKSGERIRSSEQAAAVDREAVKPKNAPRLAEIVADAVDRIAVPKRLEEENSRLRRELAELKRQLEDSRQKKG
jgi:hypothetical protein